MDRFTFISDGYYAITNENCFDDQNEDYQGPAIERLAAYEDTGLEPSEIELMQSQAHLCHTCKHEFPTCKNEKIIFGSGLGNDNVVYCDGYEEHGEAYHFKAELDHYKQLEADGRLIDANSIVKVAEHAYNEWNLAMAAADGKCEINRVFKMQELCKAVKAVADKAPTVDAVPVVHGKWKFDDFDGDGYDYTCSVCGLSFRNSGNYCPNCGAKMDGGKS
jgi:hypothetical protein